MVTGPAQAEAARVPATEAEIWDYLREVKDPEIPVVDVVGMGIVRAVAREGETLRVTITPTYSGCPAMHQIEREIREQLHAKGERDVVLKTELAPAWTTDWMTPETRALLKTYGIAPPRKTCATDRSPFHEPDMTSACPYCDSGRTELRSLFGSTACKALHYCHDCQEPFEAFKCI